MSIINKIVELLNKQGRTQKELTDFLGITNNAFTDWKSGRIKSYNKYLSEIAEFLGVSVDYLLGKEPPVDIFAYKNISPLPKTKKVPYLGSIACGRPIFADEVHGEYIEIKDDINADFCLTAKGDSMINARILNGDLVFIRSQSSVNNGEIAAVIIDDEATLKRVYFYPDSNKLVLNPENPQFEPSVFVGEELKNVKILGKAVAFQSLIK